MYKICVSLSECRMLPKSPLSLFLFLFFKANPQVASNTLRAPVRERQRAVTSPTFTPLPETRSVITESETSQIQRLQIIPASSSNERSRRRPRVPNSNQILRNRVALRTTRSERAAAPDMGNLGVVGGGISIHGS